MLTTWDVSQVPIAPYWFSAAMGSSIQACTAFRRADLLLGTKMQHAKAKRKDEQRYSARAVIRIHCKPQWLYGLRHCHRSTCKAPNKMQKL
eukprot:5446896-Amphidinium_carterae.1